MIYKFLSMATINKAEKLVGNLELLLNKKKVIHCVKVYLKDYEKFDWFLIKNKQETPTLKEDYFLLMLFRSLCDGIINSVEILCSYSIIILSINN